MIIAGIVIGFLLGAMVGAFFDEDLAIIGGFIGAFFGFWLSFPISVYNRLRELERTSKSLQETLARLTSSTPKPAVVTPPPSVITPASTPIAAVVRSPEITEKPIPLPPASQVPEYPPGHPGYRARPARASADELPPYMTKALTLLQNFFSGGNTIVRVGVLILFFGMAFLVKYAAEHALLSPEMRLIGAALGAIVLLVFGWRLRMKRQAYAYALQGGAIGILYLTVFAALRLYQLLPPAFSFGVLVALALFSSMLAILQNARSLAIVGMVGGFLAPILTSSGSGSHVMLFSYYALLNSGILAISWFRAWRELNLIGFFFTFGIGAAWGYRSYQPELFLSTEPFLVLFFIFYVLIALLFAARQPLQLKGYVDGTLVFGVPLIGFGLQAVLVREYEFGLAISAFIMALFYVMLATFLFRRQQAEQRTLSESFLVLGIVFATLSIPLAVDSRWTAASWALEGAAIIWVSFRQQRLLGRIFGALLIFGGGIFFFKDWQAMAPGLPLMNSFYLGCVMVAVAALFSSRLFYLSTIKKQAYEEFIALALLVWGLLWWYGGGLTELNGQVNDDRVLHLGILFVALSCLVAEGIGAQFSWPQLRSSALGFLPAAFIWVLPLWVFFPHPLMFWGWLIWPMALVAHYVVLYRRRDFKHSYMAFLHGGSVWLVALLVTLEAAWWLKIGIFPDLIWTIIAWGLVPAILTWVIASRKNASSWPWQNHYRHYLLLGLAPLMVWMLFWSFFLQSSNNGNVSPLPYVPLLNFLDLTQICIILAVFLWYQQMQQVYKHPHLITYQPHLMAVSGTVLFVWFNAMILRTLHHSLDLPWRFWALANSMQVQASLSIAWTVLALSMMIFATRRSMRLMWVVGGILLGVVVLKLFIVDMSRSGNLARIISFIVVGVLLLIIGYFSPLPPKQKYKEPVNA